MEPSSDERLFTALAALRPAPAPAFAAELDERAAEGFPPRVHPASAPFARLAAWLGSLPPRRMILTGGATALAALAVATVVISGSNSGSSSDGLRTLSAVDAAGNPTSGAGVTAGEKLPSTAAPSGKSSSGNSSAAGSSSTEFEGKAFEAEPMEEASAGAEEVGSEFFDELGEKSASKAPTGPYASGANHRDVERAAEMVLGTEPGEVGEAAGKVLEAVHQFDGIVLSSSVRGGSEGDAGARFDLLIPSAKLSDALAAFSGIAEVRSRHEASNDITAPTNTIGEGLQDSHAKIDALLNELAGSETEAEREAVEAQLRSERHHAAALKAQLSNLQRRANLSHVSVRIETGASSAPSGGGGWDIGDAFHDAGHILSIAAGVAIVALAILAPIALLALLLWLGNRTWARRRRERALG
jgi:Domain of unknown function (DUF4349)